MADTENTSIEAKNMEVEEKVAAGQKEAAQETEDNKQPKYGKGKTDKNGNYTHYFKNPVEILGKKYSSMTFYFDKLTGEDMEAIEDELLDQNKFVLTPETSSAFQCILAAKAAGIPSDEIRRLPMPEYIKIKNAARNFLIKAD